MPGNGKVFISHTHEDNERCAPLLAALDAWGVEYWFDTQQLDAGQHLSDRLQQALAEHDVLLRICTPAAQSSYWMMMEMNAFRGLQLEDQQRKRHNARLSINLILAPGYVASAADRADIVIDAMNQPRQHTFAELRTALGLSAAARPKRGVSRRAVLGLGAAGIITAGALASGGVLLKDRNEQPVHKPYPKPKTIPFDNPQTMDPRIKWYFKAGDDLGMGLALANGALVLNTQDGLYALKSEDGSILWTKLQIRGDASSMPWVAGNVLYVAASEGFTGGTLYALKASDGSQIWTAQIASSFEDLQIAVATDRIFMVTDDGSIIAYSTADGSKQWRSATAMAKGARGAPASDGNAVYIGSPDGNLYALSAADGSLLWQHQTGGEIADTPAIAGGAVYFGSKDQHMYALNATDGSLKWRYAAGNEVNIAPTVAKGVAYIGLLNNLNAFDANTGKLLWQAPAGDPNGFEFIDSVAATVLGDAIYAVSDNYLYAFSAEQKKSVWRFKLNSILSLDATMVATSDTLYFGGADHALYALNTTLPQ
ncbi:MAG: hypothetical protein OJF49_001174 [Ktedonobacterales bacterium]|jgi:outer membrane protein assembly factor BamB|nr:MAG: hypothetical protein OJF49_001174 [Ktedonobacterales bacterium]